jgi:hypothetical protein
MPLKARRQVHHAEVVERALFATLNSLKSQVGQNLKSPYGDTRAITPKLCAHSRPTAFEITRLRNRNYGRHSTLDSARRTAHVPLPVISSFRRFRTPVAGVRGIARARPASENARRSGCKVSSMSAEMRAQPAPRSSSNSWPEARDLRLLPRSSSVMTRRGSIGWPTALRRSSLPLQRLKHPFSRGQQP